MIHWKGYFTNKLPRPTEGQLESEKQNNDLELQLQLTWSRTMLKLKGKERSIFLGLCIFIGVTRVKKQELQHCMLEQRKRNYCIVIPWKLRNAFY